MTAKDKALEIFGKMKTATTFQYQEYAGAHYSTFEHDTETIKQCALIVINEILNNASDTIIQDTNKLICSQAYWQSVKNELETI